MSFSARIGFTTLALAAVFLVALGLPAKADVVLEQCTWQTIGTNVHFELKFHNPDLTNPSGAVSGQMNSQPFGAFLPDHGPIGSFNVPPLPPDSFFDVFFEVPLADLPPSADKITPGDPGGGFAPAESPAVNCPPDLFWAGNVDIFWSGDGGAGQANYHFGTLQICPGGPPSYIHVFGDCPDPAGLSWFFSGVCPGWSLTLVTSDGMGQPGGPAPNPLPAGFFDGWICISANAGVAIGSTCCSDLNLACGIEPAVINICSEACSWEPPLPTTESSWGKVKAKYRK
jgi:hypothetical protein